MCWAPSIIPRTCALREPLALALGATRAPGIDFEYPTEGDRVLRACQARMDAQHATHGCRTRMDNQAFMTPDPDTLVRRAAAAEWNP